MKNIESRESLLWTQPLTQNSLPLPSEKTSCKLLFMLLVVVVVVVAAAAAKKHSGLRSRPVWSGTVGGLRQDFLVPSKAELTKRPS